MYLETTQIVQLSGALLAAIVIFVAAYAAPFRLSVGILLVLIPFQPVATIYGSANVVMTYVLVGALFAKGSLRYAPMLGAIVAVILTWLISMSQLPRSLYVLHGVEVIALVSGFLVFILAYNLTREAKDPRAIINLFMLTNVLAIVYCFIQIGIGPGEKLELFGMKEFSMNRNRGGGDARLVGPFGTPGITAAYFMSMSLMLIYEAIHSLNRRRVFALALIVLNVVLILATANRGSFLVLAAGILVLLYAFRAKLGLGRIVQILVASAVVLAATATMVGAYTDFGRMFDRLARTTELEGGMPATRAVLWPRAWENIKEKPLIGHGPRILARQETRFRDVPPEQLVGSEPHNLYLHLLLTVGVVGTASMLFFLVATVRRVYQGAKCGLFDGEYERGWALVGTIVLATFLVDELKIEFLRYTTVDYAHFVFALFGIFLGWSDRARANAQAVARNSKPRNSVA